MTVRGLHLRTTLLLPAFLLLLCTSTCFGQSTVYEYQVPAGGYDGVGNLTASMDSVNGAWSIQYDSLNRFQNASSSSGPYQGYAMTEGYDSFGNRLSQTVTYNNSPTQQTIRTDYDNTDGSSCPHAGSNRLCATSLNGVLPTDPSMGMDNGHDAAGNLLSDGVNYYKYDAEGRMCASYSTMGSGYTQYFYDAEGNRVAKGSSSTFDCPGASAPPAGSITAKYLVGPSGEKITELDGNNTWVQTNVYANGALLARYNPAGVHFPISDPLGTVRMEVLNTSLAAGTINQQCSSLAFGDGQVCSAPGTTEEHFTGEERDIESGLDYFRARYYGSVIGRFTSPDDGSDQNGLTPQSWNLYSYVQNNPLTHTDADGHSVVVCTSDEVGSLRCSAPIDNASYDIAAKGNNGSLTVPSEQSVERTGSGNITDSDNKTVGTVRYVADGGLDGPANLAGANMIGYGGMAAIKEFAIQSSIGALMEGVGQGIGLGVNALRVARAAKAAEAAEALAVAERVTQHAYLKHAGEFGNISRNEFQGLVQETMSNPSEVRSLSNGRTAYWSDSQQMVVIENGTAPTQSTAFRPSGGKSYFDNLH